MVFMFDEKKILSKLARLKALLLGLLFALAFIATIFIVDEITCRWGGIEGTECNKIGIFTSEERFIKDDGKKRFVHELSDAKEGDILISMSTHTLGWRHGHAGIVMSTNPNYTAEAALLGKPSARMNMKHWESYGTLYHLRVKEEYAQKALNDLKIDREEEISAQMQLGILAGEFAQEYGIDKKYSFLAGFGEKGPVKEEFSATQCAHLIWYIYNQFGIDTDSDGGSIVTPQDILDSELLERLN
ncbi:MAG: hypothetical protein PHW03_00805 [Eubacteriales bacterium]|nr:hypothetical protein [Eubacteriales bacterium]MDD4389321.1 hypothetical protein [Eubacteriales bacterium]